MWRKILFLLLILSIGLNWYLFNQLASNNKQKELSVNKKIDDESPKPSMILKTLDDSKNDIRNADDLSLPSQIKKALSEYDYTVASRLIYQLDQKDSKKVAKVKTYWIKDVQQLIEKKDYLLAESSINAFLEYSFGNLPFLFLKVDLYLTKQQILTAVKLAYDVQLYARTLDEQEYSIKFARNLVSQEIVRLSQLNLWLELSEFCLQIIVIDPENYQLKWALAQAQYHQGEFRAALNTLSPLLTQPNFTLKANTLSEKIVLALQKPEVIPLIKQGEHFIVHGEINGEFNVALLLDTGASISLLSQARFDQLAQLTEVKYIKDTYLDTAGGKVKASIYSFDHFDIEGYSVENMLFAVYPYNVEENDGLLGMNFLRNFDFYIDQNEHLLSLTLKD